MPGPPWNPAAAGENACSSWEARRSISGHFAMASIRSRQGMRHFGDGWRRRCATGTVGLHARLTQVDPAAAARIHPNDARRIIRALEIVQATGRPTPSSWFDERPQHPVFDRQMMILDQPRRTLRERIDRRVEAMFAQGIIEETQAAAGRPGGIGATARQAAGYAETLDMLAGRMTRDEAIRLTQQRTRQLAKRQLTWLRSFKTATWLGA